MRLLISLLLLAVSAHAIAKDTESKNERDSTKEKPAKADNSIFDEFRVEFPDFSHLPEDKRDEALGKWYEENVGSGIPKPYIRFMERLEKEAKKPGKDSEYIGQWGETPQSRPQLNLAADGTFTWDYGHSKGVGIWRVHDQGIIWIGFAHTEKDDEGKEHTWYAPQQFCYLKDANTLVQYHIDTTNTYKRHAPRAPKEPINGEQGGTGQPTTAPESKAEGER